MANQEILDRQRTEVDRELALERLRVRMGNRVRERAALRAREDATTFEQQRLAREIELREANAAIMIGKIFRGHRTRAGFKQALQAQAQAA